MIASESGRPREVDFYYLLWFFEIFELLSSYVDINLQKIYFTKDTKEEIKAV